MMQPMIKHDFHKAGTEYATPGSMSDDDIARQIAALECILAYAQTRRDMQIIMMQLLHDLDMFRRFATQRKMDLSKYPFFQHD